MKVLLSIKPEFAYKIFDGSKRFEFRKSIFKRSDVDKIVVYASAPVQRVIGEFNIAQILSNAPQNLWEETKEYAGISKSFFLKYFKSKKTGYAIQVDDAILYETPQRLQDLNVSVPPQSFMYISQSTGNAKARKNPREQCSINFNSFGKSGQAISAK
jgi:predicted transcriptional regulator